MLWRPPSPGWSITRRFAWNSARTWLLRSGTGYTGRTMTGKPWNSSPISPEIDRPIPAIPWTCIAVHRICKAIPAYVHICLVHDTSISDMTSLNLGFSSRRYKFIVQVTVIEKRGQSLQVSNGRLWDNERDTYSTFSFESPQMYATGIVVGVYYEWWTLPVKRNRNRFDFVLNNYQPIDSLYRLWNLFESGQKIRRRTPSVSFDLEPKIFAPFSFRPSISCQSFDIIWRVLIYMYT